jgi:hypothetical protein
MKFRSLLLFFFFSIFFFKLSAQNSSFQIWLDYDHTYKLNDKWRFFSDYGFREQSEQLFRLHARPSFAFKNGNLLEYRAGLGLFYLFGPDRLGLAEIRPWQGILLSWPNFGRLHFKNYMRFEERFTFLVNDNFDNYSIKWRYKIGLKVPLNNRSVAEKTFFIPLSFEVFFDIFNENQFLDNDRIRFEAGLGYRFNDRTTLTVLYTLQETYYQEFSIINFNEGFKQIDNVLRITLSQRFNFDN